MNSQDTTSAQAATNIHHFAIIPDGNRRWARRRGLPPYEGHRQALKTLENILPVFKEYNIPYVTVWAFSTENWKRPKQEIDILFELITQLSTKSKDKLQKNNIRVRTIGRRDRFPNRLLKAIKDIEDATKNNTAYTLIIPLDYGGQDEIRRAVLKLLTQIKTSKLTLDQAINNLLELEQAVPFITSFMDAPDVPFPDVILRTSGEMRLSGLYSWENAYAELFFIQKFFPDLTPQDIINVINEFNQRDRRFGGDSKSSQ